MIRKFVSITLLASLGLFLLTGCGDSKNNEVSESSKLSNSVSTASSSSSQNSSTSDSSPASSASTESAASSETQATDSNASEVTTATESGQTEASAEPAVDPAYPYAVDVTRFNAPTTFNLNGVNVPPAIRVENQGGLLVSFVDRRDPAAPGDQYSAQAVTIPTREIRISSHDGSGIRTVKVNTQLILTSRLSGRGADHTNETLYVLTNRNGGLSLITPNYAGNVEEADRDVLLEAA